MTRINVFFLKLILFLFCWCILLNNKHHFPCIASRNFYLKMIKYLGPGSNKLSSFIFHLVNIIEQF